MTHAIGIDFGTTNSVVAIAAPDGSVRTLTFPSQAGLTETFRTALLLWSEGRMPRAVLRHVAGPQALEGATAGLENHRFVQSIKTYVASRLFKETRLFGQTLSIEAIVAIFLDHLIGPHRHDLRLDEASVVAGRPVVFAGHNADADLAEVRLQDSYGRAGFGPVSFAFEPLGAAYWYARTLKADATVLVADFGGGTSDFSVMRFTRAKGALVATPLAHDGVGVAGDTFDARLVEHLVAPRLGRDARTRSFDKWLPIPAYLHAALAHWHQLSWLKTPATLAELRRLIQTSDAPDAMAQLLTLVEMDLGFELHHAINAVKVRLSQADTARLVFARHGVTIEADVTRRDFERWIAPDLAAIAGAVDGALNKAGLAGQDIDAVFMTGGTSLVPAVQRLFAERFGAERIRQGDTFHSVASGLALLAADRRRSGDTARSATARRA